MGLFDKNNTAETQDNQPKQDPYAGQIKWLMGMMESLQKANAELSRKLDAYSSKIEDMEKRMSMLTMSMGNRSSKTQPVQQGMNQNSFQQAAYQQQGVPQGLPQGGQQFAQMPQQGFPQQQGFGQMQQGFPQQGFNQMQQPQGFPQQQSFVQAPQQEFTQMQQPQQEFVPQPNNGEPNQNM